MGSLSSTGLKGRIGHEWSQIKTQQGSFVKNNYSEQEFQLFSIPNTEINNNNLYFTREFSSLPKTPKIICLERQKQNFLILVERGQKTICQWLGQNHCELSILLKFKDTLSAASALKNKFGSFLITEKMIKISSNDNLLGWYNEKFESNIVQLPLSVKKQQIQNEQIMIQNIVEIFRKCVNKEFNINLLISGIKTFSQLKSRVRQRIEQIEHFLSSKTTSLASIQFNRSLTQEKQKKRKSASNKKRQFLNQRKRISSNNPTLQNSVRLQRSKNVEDNQEQIKQIRKLKNEITQGKKKIIQMTGFNKQYHFIKKQFRLKQKALSALDQKSSQNYSSSSAYSSNDFKKQNQSELDKEQTPKSYKSINYSEKLSDKPRYNKIFLKRQTKFEQFNSFLNVQHQHFQQAIQQPAVQQKYCAVQNSVYKAADSFSSKKHFSLKSTSGTLKRTRQFEDHFRQMMLQQREAIKEQSDQTHKNSNNYSVQQSVKEQAREQMLASVTLSQDFNNLFSPRDSIAQGMEDSTRQRQFQKILFGNH